MEYPFAITTNYDADKRTVVISASVTSNISESLWPLITRIAQAWLEDFSARGVTGVCVTIKIIQTG